MKAVVYEDYGGPEVLQLKEIDKPTPKANEVLIQNFASSVNFGDIYLRKFNTITPQKFSMPSILWVLTKLLVGINKPKRKTLGSEFAGVVSQIGPSVKQFKQGDQVFGYRGMEVGTNAEYLTMPEKSLISIKPSNINFEESATIPYGALTAFSLLKKMSIKPGQKVLINGASGSIGSAALQLAKYYGAEVTGVCGTSRIEYVKALGADKVIDYTKEDFTKNSETYDLIFDILNKSSFSKCKNSLTTQGKYLLASFKMKQLLQMLVTSLRRGKKVVCALSNNKPEDLIFIKELVENGKIKTIIDKSFPLDQATEAHSYYESAQRKSSVVLSINYK